MSAVLFAVMVLAAYRVWRLIAVDMFPPVAKARDAVMSRLPYGSSVGYLIGCPWCLGAWCSIAVVALACRYTSVPLPYAQAAAVSTAVGLLHQFDQTN